MGQPPVIIVQLPVNRSVRGAGAARCLTSLSRYLNSVARRDSQETGSRTGCRNAICSYKDMSGRALHLAAAVLASVAMACADGEKLGSLKAGSETYTDVTVISVTATDVYFSHSRGLANVKLKSLEPDLQKRFHFDAARAAEKEKEQKDEKLLYAESVEKAKVATPVKALESVEEAPGLPGLPDEVEPHEIAAKSFLNQRAPAIMADKWLTPPPDITGRFIMLEFWGTWCAPCRHSIPKLNSFANGFKDRLVVIGLSDETEEVVQRMKEPKIDYSIAIDPQHRASSTFGVERIPHLVLIDPKGVVRFEGHPGYLDDRKLEKLLSRFAD